MADSGIRHADAIPLIGGMALGSERAFGSRPEYLMSYTPFASNDSHLVKYYEGAVPYVVIDRGGLPPRGVDVVSSTCPCAGLSTCSRVSGGDHPTNEWLATAAEYVLGAVRPAVYWGENAPALATDMGTPIRERIRAIGRQHGYAMSMYRTKSLLHGVPQVRERSFYFFWRAKTAPVLGWHDRPHQRIEDLLDSVRSNFQTEPINRKTPTRDDPYYRYVLEELCPGASHREYQALPRRDKSVLEHIEDAGVGYGALSAWMAARGHDRAAARCLRREAKGGVGMYKTESIVPRDYVGAFVSHYPKMMTHHREDRYISYREAMSIMGLPQDFELLDPRRNYNHVCQNVPVDTAADMAGEVRKYLEGKLPDSGLSYVLQRNHDHTIEAKFADVVRGGSLEEMFA